MSASEPAIAMRDIRCPRCGRTLQRPYAFRDGRGNYLLEEFVRPMNARCEQPGCDWSGTVIWAEIVEAKEPA